ncbi:unnamed protein product [Leptosia nina]|uniref:U3 small nucleolar RNA-associated protein 6 homolog n=1 Tax=Leptosia nina TaxID=320188 RepID=A0AAV1JNX1_9NEOP
MAELVNQRIEGMINELEQMRRVELYDDEEIRDISRKRKEFEYRIQRRIKEKDDFVQYIAYELALLEDISLRRKQAKMFNKRQDIEYAIAKRVNKVFKQFIMRYQNDVQIYFEYIKFCKSVNFEYAISSIIHQMLQVHGDKPKTWQLASLFESKEKKNLDTARSFLLKGIHRHPEAEVLYLELFEIELKLSGTANDEEKEKYLKRAEVVWMNGMKNVPNLSFLFKICDLSLKYNNGALTNSIKEEVWSKRNHKEVWSYIASKELEGYHWREIDEFVDDENQFSKELNHFTTVYEEALQQFPDEKLCTQYIHHLLGLNDCICTENQKIHAVKQAWMYGHENGLLSNDMYAFGISFMKLEKEDYSQIIDTAVEKNPKHKFLWQEKLLLNKRNENVILSVLQQASKTLKDQDLLYLWNFMLDNVENDVVLKNVYKKFQSCESITVLSLKPKLLQKIYEHNGLKTARESYEDFIKTPPTQVELHKAMIEIEMSQEKPNLKCARKCYECLVQHHGKENIDIWLDYIKFESSNGGAKAVPQVHRRAVATLKADLVDGFVKAQTLSRLQ